MQHKVVKRKTRINKRGEENKRKGKIRKKKERKKQRKNETNKQTKNAEVCMCICIHV
jgi:hypothetical protein